MFYMNFSREIALFENLVIVHITLLVVVLVPPRRARPLAGHADAEARRSVLTALLCATLVTVERSAIDSVHVSSQVNRASVGSG